MKFYLAGPMSGIPQFNYPLFDKSAARLRERGLEIVSPAELDDAATRAHAMASLDGKGTGPNTWGDFLARDVKIVADQVQGVILLPRWYTSRGAKLEAYVGILCHHEFHAYYPDRDKLVELDLYWVLDLLKNASLPGPWRYGA